MRLNVLGFTVSTIMMGAALHSTAMAGPSLLTADQKQAQTEASAAFKDPAIQTARAAAIKRYESAPPAQLPDGKSTLSAAVDEAVYGTLLALSNDPVHPGVIWSQSLPYQFGGNQIPGTRYGGDDPDRIYRAIAVDPAGHYEIHGKRLPGASLDFSFEAISGPALWGKARAVLPAKDVDVASDGTFVITADSSPTDGRRNHLQLPAGAANILVRDTLNDWSTQLPNELSVQRIDQGAASAGGQGSVVQRAPVEIQKSIDESLNFIAGVWKNPPNHLFPVVRGLGDGVKGGIVAVNRFHLEADEALVITLDPLHAKYVGIEVTDPWLRSADYAKRSTSLNASQATTNADGTLTYVLSAKDPGVHNWLDSAGLHDGILLSRWEIFPGEVQADKAVRAVRVVKSANLAGALPQGGSRVDASQRQQWLSERTKSYEHRLGLE
ncbi:MAG TPA: hypothetical protein VHZ99_14095 [Steroidobacteraceae bacterium]|jgi:hypothetical protein|nr:hypothetical protein [Steroidobacteraceae bacterium]